MKNMIHGSINNPFDKEISNLNIKRALDFIRKNDFSKFPTGIKTNLEEDNSYFIIHEYKTEPKQKRKAEVHRKYVDIHFILSGKEKVEVGKQGKGLLQVYQDEQDAELYEDIYDGKEILLEQGEYIIMLPGEVHRGGIEVEAEAQSLVRKLVFKILTEE